MTDEQILEIARQQTNSHAVKIYEDTLLRVGRAIATAAAQPAEGEPTAWLIEANHLAHKTGYAKRWVTFDKPHPRTEWDVTALYAASAQPLPSVGAALTDWDVTALYAASAQPLPSVGAALTDQQAWDLYVRAQEAILFKSQANRDFGIAFVKSILANAANV